MSGDEKGAYEPTPGELLHVWPGARLTGIEPRRAVALTGPVPFGGTACVRVEYLSGRRVGGTDYLALTHVEPASAKIDERCACVNPAGLRCTWDATEADRLCAPCRMGKPVMGDGQHWCRSSSTPARTDSGATP